MPKSKRTALEVQGLTIAIINRNSQDYISLTDIALRETLYNPDFKPIEFERFRNEAGSNYFVLSPQRWIAATNAIGIVSKSGRYGGTFAHKDIAFEFATWISSAFKLYLITEFQRLKTDENDRLQLEWNLRRTLAKVNYRIHTDAIKETLLPVKITKAQATIVYAKLIRQELPQPERLLRLNQVAITQMRSLLGSASMKRLT
jgi:hypothetical protein